ncbi:hypothetical protein [Halopseudomonas oceani]|uniref:hypothetical protein n=1 Tax=Halopseudomonas oceani TaxID=1708783 RepID=UPI002AA67EEA|nr:hypothetical protein [Halopseudomonas oceani]
MKHLRIKLGATALAATLSALPLTASASDVGFGVGISYIFGQGPAVGIKAFSDDEADRAAAVLGLDYVFANGGLRPNVGVAYLGNDYYGDANVGYNFGNSRFDFGVGAGWSDADNQSSNHASAPGSPQRPPEPGNGNGEPPPPQQP